MGALQCVYKSRVCSKVACRLTDSKPAQAIIEARLSSEEGSFYKKTYTYLHFNNFQVARLIMEKLVVILVLTLGALLMLKSAQASDCRKKSRRIRLYRSDADAIPAFWW